MARGQGQKKGVDPEKPICRCGHERPKSPGVYCTCKNNAPEGETQCLSCQRDRHVY